MLDNPAGCSKIAELVDTIAWNFSTQLVSEFAGLGTMDYKGIWNRE